LLSGTKVISDQKVTLLYANVPFTELEVDSILAGEFVDVRVAIRPKDDSLEITLEERTVPQEHDFRLLLLISQMR
jgi:hypothetical protein